MTRVGYVGIDLRETKLQKWQYLGSWIIFYFVMVPKS